MLNDFNKSPVCYWNEKTQISFLQRCVLIHSYLYYERNTTLISDLKYDRLTRLLVEKQNENKAIIERTEYGKVFNSFDGSTGFDLLDKLSEKERKKIVKIAEMLLRSK